jgi:hypothetical protein
LHRMRGAGWRFETLNGGDLPSGCAVRRIQTWMHRLAIDPDGASAAVASVAAPFYSEPFVLAKEAAQALSWSRIAEHRTTVD